MAAPAKFDEGKHPRGQPDNPGQFAPKVGEEAEGGVDALVANSYDDNGFSSLSGTHRDTGTLWSPPNEYGVSHTDTRELGDSGIFKHGIRDADGTERWVGNAELEIELFDGPDSHYEPVDAFYEFHGNPSGGMDEPMSATVLVTDNDGEAHGGPFDVRVEADPDRYSNRWEMAVELREETYHETHERVREYLADGSNFI